MKEILEKNVLTLNLRRNLYNKLLSKNINTIFEICSYSRMELAELKFDNEEINEIIIKLQLIGLDLKANHAKRNVLLDCLK